MCGHSNNQPSVEHCICVVMFHTGYASLVNKLSRILWETKCFNPTWQISSDWPGDDCLIRSKQVATVCVVCGSVIITQYYNSTVWRYPITTHTTLYSILIINGTYVNIYHFSLTYCVTCASAVLEVEIREKSRHKENETELFIWGLL